MPARGEQPKPGKSKQVEEGEEEQPSKGLGKNIIVSMH